MIDRRKIFRDAHFAARGRHFNNPALSYAKLFADCLKLEYARARERRVVIPFVPRPSPTFYIRSSRFVSAVGA